MSNGLAVLALPGESISKVVMRAFLFGRFFHTIGPEFYLAIPGAIPPSGASRKKKDHTK